MLAQFGKPFYSIHPYSTHHGNMFLISSICLRTLLGRNAFLNQSWYFKLLCMQLCHILYKNTNIKLTAKFSEIKNPPCWNIALFCFTTIFVIWEHLDFCRAHHFHVGLHWRKGTNSLLFLLYSGNNIYL